VGKYNPWDIVQVCPVDAIKLTNMPMPPQPEGAKKPAVEVPVADTGPWMERWLAVKGQREPQWETLKRYGLASSLEDEGNQYRLRLELPEKVPNHKLKFQWGLPDKMPDYQTSVTIDGKRVKVRGKLTDPEVLKLCGWVNSFPDGFLRELNLEAPVKSHKENYDPETRVLEVTLEKA